MQGFIGSLGMMVHEEQLDLPLYERQIKGGDTCECCGQVVPHPQYVSGAWDLHDHSIFYKGIRLQLTLQQRNAVEVLIKNKEASHEMIADRCLSSQVDPERIKVLICNIRKRLPPGVGIKSIHGKGYKLIYTSA